MEFRASSAQDNAHRMIYVSDLPKATSYLDLSDFYERNVGPCQICIKRPLFKNFYYAFVMFETIELAKKAQTEQRYPRIKGGLMSRSLPYNMHAVRGEPGGRDVQSTSIFIKGFEKVNWNHEDLYAKFCDFGKIISCKVSINPEHDFLGYGYIQYSQIQEAQKAIEEMDKYALVREAKNDSQRDEIGDSRLVVSEYHNNSNKVKSRRSFNNVYVKGFPKDTGFTEECLEELFKEFGEVTSAAIMRDGNGESKGFGFVCFTDPTHAEKAMKVVMHSEAAQNDDEQPAQDYKIVNGVKITDLYVREAKKKSQRIQELQMSNFKYKKSIMFFSLFVKNFPVGTTDDELKIYFQSACQGEVSRVKVIPDTQQAFVNFEKQDQCKLAKEFARNVLFKSQYALYVEYCYPKEMRSIRNEEIFDKRAQERKRSQQSQAQLANMSGSQNLIDLLTMLLKPAFQMGMNNGQQRRSHSMNSGMGNGGRSNYQNGNQMGHTNSQGQQRFAQNNNQRQHFSSGQRPVQTGMGARTQQMQQPVMGMPNPGMGSQMMNQQMMAQMQPQQPGMMVQKMPISGAGYSGNASGSYDMGSGSMSSAQQSQSVSQHVSAEYANNYTMELKSMFMSPEFKNTSNKATKKELIGNTIYKHVEKLVGEQKAPKITGMLIDLPEVELNFSIVTWAEFEGKVLSALQMIGRTEPEQPRESPMKVQ